jgi:transcriptional regulator with XRE-family HTH domain
VSDIGNKEIFARNLAYYIERSGRTQRDLSLAWDVPTSTINNWVMGKTYPRMGKIELMANYFGILKSDLIEDKTKQPDITDGLTESQLKLIEFAKTVPEDKAAMILRVIQSIVEADE